MSYKIGLRRVIALLLTLAALASSSTFASEPLTVAEFVKYRDQKNWMKGKTNGVTVSGKVL